MEFFKVLIYVVFLVASCNSTTVQATTLQNDLLKKYCPLINFDGKPYCPVSKTVSYNGGGQIRAGFGYDKLKNEVKFPVFQTNLPTRQTKSLHDVKRFTNAREFYNFILGSKSQVIGGLYVSSNSMLNNFATRFSDGEVNIGVTQKLIYTHQVNVKDRVPIIEFVDAINHLPEYNKNNANSLSAYRMIINFWGTDIGININYGGLIWQQTIVKSCYGGNINGDMINDLESIIESKKPGSGYLNYRRLGIFQIIGGNPEFGSTKIKERISTFERSPAPIDFSSIPLWSIITDTKKREWMKQAIEDYINQNQVSTDSLIKQIEQQKIENWKKSQRIYLIDSNTEQGGTSVVYWEGCPRLTFPGRTTRRWFRRRRTPTTYYTPRCSLIRSVVNLQAGQRTDNVAGKGGALGIWIERNSNGDVRIISNDGKKSTSWIKSGCVTLSLSDTIRRSVCIGSTPYLEHSNAQHNQKHTDLKSRCEGF